MPRVAHTFFAAEVPAQVGYIADAIAAFDAAAAKLGLAIEPQVANLALAQVMGESNFGRSGTLGGNDWGAFQAGMTKAGKPVWIASFAKKYVSTAGVGGLAHRDYQPPVGGSPGFNFVAYYRVYPSQYVAAEDWLSVMGPRLGLGGSEAPQDSTEYATKAYLTGYFGGVHAGARPVGQRSEPFNDAEQANILDYAQLIERGLPSVQSVRANKVEGRNPKLVDFPSILPLAKRLSAGLVASGATAAQMAEAASKAFPSGGANGDYKALLGTNGLAWVSGPPPGYKKDGTPGSDANWMLRVGVALGVIGTAVAVGKANS